MPPETVPDGLPPIKVCLACSHGGHLAEMLRIREALEGHEVFYFCYDAATTRILKNARLVPNMARNPVEFLKNLVRVTRVFREEKPDLVISTGAEIAIPVMLVAKLFRVATLYIECGAQVAHPSLTGRVVSRLVDDFLVQWKELVPVYGLPALFRGSLVDEDEPVQKDRSDEERVHVTLVQPPGPVPPYGHLPPLGLARAAAALERAGCRVRVLDARAETLSPRQAAAILRRHDPGLVCVSVANSTRTAALESAEFLRRLGRSPMLVAWDPGGRVAPEGLLREGGFDFVVRGDESCLAEVVECLVAGEPPGSLAGVAWRRDDGGVIHNPVLSLSNRPDDCLRPDWSLFPLHRYPGRLRRGTLCLPIATSRPSSAGEAPRLRAPEAVADEWEFLVRRYGAREIAVVDDSFAAQPDRARVLCELLVQRDLHRVAWTATVRCDENSVTAGLLRDMGHAGCRRVWFRPVPDAQPGEKTRDANSTWDRMRAAVVLARGAGLEVGVCIAFGYHMEAWTGIRDTVRLCRALDPDLVLFSAAPGAGSAASASQPDHAALAAYCRRATARFRLRPRAALRRLRRRATKRAAPRGSAR